MAKVTPLFLNSSGALEKLSETNLMNESFIQMASESGDGLMSSSDKTKLDGLTADTLSFVAATAITAGQVCAINSSGKTILADKGDVATKGEVVALYNSAAGSSKAYASPNYGVVTAGSGLSVGGPVFLGDSGAVTADVPTDVGDIVQRIGTATATDKVMVDIESIVVVN